MSKVLHAEKEGYQVLKFIGDVRLSLSPSISSYLSRVREFENFRGMLVDLSETTSIDSTALGLIAKLAIFCREAFGHTLSIITPRDDIRRLLLSMSMQQVSIISSEFPTAKTRLEELPLEAASEEVLLKQVLEAHEILISLAAENESRFKDLVESLRKEQSDRFSPATGNGQFEKSLA